MSVCLDPNELLNKNQHSIPIKNRWLIGDMKTTCIDSFWNFRMFWHHEFFGKIFWVIWHQLCALKSINFCTGKENYWTIISSLICCIFSWLQLLFLRKYVTVKSWCDRKKFLGVIPNFLFRGKPFQNSCILRASGSINWPMLFSLHIRRSEKKNVSSLKLF